jgi:hypothetical protein
MLAISETTLSSLEATARPLFARRVREALAERYPHFLPRFPEPVQALIVGNMLGRAARWSIHGQRALLAFCELMISIAANFDEHPEIRGVLEKEQGGRDRALLALPRQVSAAAWADARSNAVTVPFYLRPSTLAQPPAEQAAAAVALALYDRPEAHDATNAVQGAANAAAGLNLPVDADGLLVVTACRTFYGEAFDERRLSWAPMIFGSGLDPRTVLHALRLRLALDFARFV